MAPPKNKKKNPRRVAGRKRAEKKRAASWKKTVAKRTQAQKEAIAKTLSVALTKSRAKWTAEDRKAHGKKVLAGREKARAKRTQAEEEALSKKRSASQKKRFEKMRAESAKEFSRKCSAGQKKRQATMTDEQKDAHAKSVSAGQLLRWKNATDEDREEWGRQVAERFWNMTAEDRKEWGGRMADWWATLSDEERKEMGEKISAGMHKWWATLSDAERKEIGEEISARMKAWWASLSDAESKEIREMMSARMKAWWASLSDAEKKEIGETISARMKAWWANLSDADRKEWGGRMADWWATLSDAKKKEISERIKEFWQTERGQALRLEISVRMATLWRSWEKSVEAYKRMHNGWMRDRAAKGESDDLQFAMLRIPTMIEYAEVVKVAKDRAEGMERSSDTRVVNFWAFLIDYLGGKKQRTVADIMASLEHNMRRAVKLVGSGGEIDASDLVFQFYPEDDAISYSILGNLTPEQAEEKNVSMAAVMNFEKKAQLHSTFHHPLVYNLKPVNSGCGKHDPHCLIGGLYKLYLGVAYEARDGKGVIGFCMKMPGGTSGETSFLKQLTGTRTPRPSIFQLNCLLSLVYQSSRNQLKAEKYQHKGENLPLFVHLKEEEDTTKKWVWSPRILGKWHTYEETKCPDIKKSVGKYLRLSCE